MSEQNKSSNTKPLISELQQVIETAIAEDERIQKLKQHIDEAQNLFDTYYNASVSSNNIRPDEDTIIEIADELGISRNKLDIEFVQSNMEHSSFKYIGDQMKIAGFDLADIFISNDDHEDYYSMSPVTILYDNNYTPEYFQVSIDDAFVNSLDSENESDIKNLMDTIKSKGLTPLYNYNKYGKEAIWFDIGIYRYSDIDEATNIVEDWISDMQTIVAFTKAYEDFVSNNVMTEMIRQTLLEVYN